MQMSLKAVLTLVKFTAKMPIGLWCDYVYMSHPHIKPRQVSTSTVIVEVIFVPNFIIVS
jgi:hypothetical protein